MKVLFDTNTWQLVLEPGRFPKNENYSYAQKIHDAVKTGIIEPFICETVVTLEAIPKGQRSAYLEKRSRDVVKFHELESKDNRTISMRVEIGGDTEAHPGMKPILKDKLKAAFEFGFKHIPVSRIGTARPSDFSEFDRYRARFEYKTEAEFHERNNKQGEVSRAIEVQGYGREPLKLIAQRIQDRMGWKNRPWYEGLNRPRDVQEDKEIDKAFAEWADGDTVAVHVGYGLDIICTQDKAKGANNSIFGQSGREWLKQQYDVEIQNLKDLSEQV